MPDLLERARRQEGDSAAGGQTEGGSRKRLNGTDQSQHHPLPLAGESPVGGNSRLRWRAETLRMRSGRAGGFLAAASGGREVPRLCFCGMLKAEDRGSRGKVRGCRSPSSSIPFLSVVESAAVPSVVVVAPEVTGSNSCTVVRSQPWKPVGAVPDRRVFELIAL